MTGRTWPVVAASSAAIAVSAGFGRFSYGFLLPAMERTTLGSFGRASWLGTINLAGYLVGVLLVTAVAGRVPATVLLRAGLAGTVLGLVLLAVSPSFGLLVVAMALVGVSSGGVWVPVTGVVAAVASPSRQGVALGVTIAGSGIGIVLADVVVTLVGSRFGPESWRVDWGIEAAAGAAVLVASTAVIPSVRGIAPVAERSWRSLRRLLDRRAVLLAYGAYGLGYVVYTTFLVAGLERSGHLSAGRAGAVFALVGATSAIGGPALGRLSDRVGRRPTLVAGQLALALCCVVLPTPALVLALVSAAVFGTLMSGVGATVVAHLSDNLEAHHLPGAFGVLTLALGVGQCIGPALGGFLVDTTGGFRATFVVAAGAFVLGAAGAWCLRRGVPGTARGVARGATVDPGER